MKTYICDYCKGTIQERSSFACEIYSVQGGEVETSPHTKLDFHPKCFTELFRFLETQKEKEKSNV